MGKTGRLGPPADGEESGPVGWQVGLVPVIRQDSRLQGADLYRLNCQGCHGEKGEGAPPEINSVINPVRATSVPLVVERMKRSGMDISPAAAAELSKQSQDALLQRIHNGGESMPAFSYLSEAEVRALVDYLKQLAGVSGAERLTVNEPPERVGELIVKSTCHTCHDAAGPNPTSQELENGAIPPLETLPARVDQLQLIRKVTVGAPVLMGTPPTLHRGRMPVFYYLTGEEAADVYRYLLAYPPSEVVRAAAPSPLVQIDEKHDTPSSGPVGEPQESRVLPQSGTTTMSEPIPDWAVGVTLVGLGASMIGLALAVVVFAGYELHRLGRAAEQRSTRPADPLLGDCEGIAEFDPKLWKVKVS